MTLYASIYESIVCSSQDANPDNSSIGKTSKLEGVKLLVTLADDTFISNFIDFMFDRLFGDIRDCRDVSFTSSTSHMCILRAATFFQSILGTEIFLPHGRHHRNRQMQTAGAVQAFQISEKAGNHGYKKHLSFSIMWQAAALFIGETSFNPLTSLVSSLVSSSHPLPMSSKLSYF